MCLPSIIEVATRAGVEFNPRSLNKTEVYAKCPFCLGDSNRAGKFKLSLNQLDNVYKCWLCGARGGVLDFESRLTGMPYHEVKNKYFGQKKKSIHPTEMLSPRQLEKIGWAEMKRKDYHDFHRHKQDILEDWLGYQREEKIKHFAMLMVVSHMDAPKERTLSLLHHIAKSCGETGIPELFSQITEEMVKDEYERSEWTVESLNIARSAWKISKKECDFEMQRVLLNTVMLCGLRKIYNKNDSLNQKSS